MKAISSADKANAISLLLSDYSIRKVESITGLGKSTVDRIYQELEMDKENYKGSRLSKHSPTNLSEFLSRLMSGVIPGVRVLMDFPLLVSFIVLYPFSISILAY